MILREVKGQKLLTQKLPGGSFTGVLLLLGRFYMMSEVTVQRGAPVIGHSYKVA